MLVTVVIATAAHGLRLAANVVSKGDDGAAFADYPMLRATAVPAVEEAISSANPPEA